MGPDELGKSTRLIRDYFLVPSHIGNTCPYGTTAIQGYRRGEKEIFDTRSAYGASIGGTRLGRSSNMINETGISWCLFICLSPVKDL